MQLDYDFSVIKNSSIKNIDDLVNLVEVHPCVVLSGSFGLGKSSVAKMIEEILSGDDKNYHIVNMIKYNIDNLRKTIEEFKQIHLMDRQKLIIINELDTSTTASVEELRGHTDGTDPLQFKVLVITNKDETLPALNDRSVYVKFIELPITTMLKNQKTCLEKEFQKEQLIEMYNVGKRYDKDKISCSYRQFINIITMIKSTKTKNEECSIEDAFESVLNDIIDTQKIDNINSYIFNIYKKRKQLDIKELINTLNTLKSHQEILHLFNYCKSILAKDNETEAWFRFNRAMIEYLSIKSKIYTDNELRQNKAHILMDVLYRAKII